MRSFRLAYTFLPFAFRLGDVQRQSLDALSGLHLKLPETHANGMLLV